MAELTIEVDDKGNIGTLPEPVQKFLDSKINDAFKRGAAKVEQDLKDRIADPAEKERLKLLEEENSRFKEAKAKADKDYETAEKIKEERHLAALKEREEKLSQTQQEIARRDTRLRASLGSEIKAAATAAGARDASLPELVKLLGADLDLDPTTLEAFVKGTDGKPKTDKAGQPVSIEGFVQQYLADNPHHLNSARGKSGRATGGASMQGLTAEPGSKDEALAVALDNPTARNVSAAIGRIRAGK
jgi:F0F1-type ATP synthase membrane subunit b/b'